MVDDEVRYRADQFGDDRDVRRREDWSDVEGKPWEDTPEPPGPVQEPPRPTLRALPDPEPTDSAQPEEPTARPDPAKGLLAWALQHLADIEAEIRYRRVVDKGDK